MYGALSPAEAGRLRRLPAICRARAGRLYASDGSRWLDCWLDGGRAYFGHRPGGVSLRLKNELERGLYAPYPGFWGFRLGKALLRLFPGYCTVRFFGNAERARLLLGLSEWPVDVLDMIFEGVEMSGKKPRALWVRPGVGEIPEADLLFPVLPVPGMEVQPVLFRDGAGIQFLPESDAVSPLFLAALTRACGIFDKEKLYVVAINADLWKVRGRYISFRGTEGEYGEMFEKMFLKRVLIAPSVKRASIIPGEISDKEMLLLNGV